MTVYQATKEDGTPEWVYNDGNAKQRFPTYEAARAAAEATMDASTRQTAAQEWEQRLRQLIGASRGVIELAQSLSLLAQTNDIEQIIDSTADGALLEGTGITKEDAATRAQLFGELVTWLSEPTEGGSIPRLAILFRRF